jgi:hypothetical protein
MKRRPTRRASLFAKASRAVIRRGSRQGLTSWSASTSQSGSYAAARKDAMALSQGVQSAHYGQVAMLDVPSIVRALKSP